MRFVPLYCLREGMISGKRLIGRNGELLLNIGSIIHESYICKIKELGYNGIYIQDELSDGIEIIDVISDSLRYKAVSALKDMFIKIENGNDLSSSINDDIPSLVDEILEKILSNKNLMVNMVDLKIFDDYTFYHSVNVGVLSILVGIALNLNKTKLSQLGLAAILHDIGKVFIPKNILNKPGKLTEAEFDVMKNHSLKGYEYLSDKFRIPASVLLGVLDHHKRFDGYGYPEIKHKKSISLFGKIIAISDVYDALSSDRPYRKALSPSESIEYIMGGSDSQFDPEIVTAFVRKIAPYPVGTLINLSNSTKGIVLENYSEACLRPKVKIIKHGNDFVTPYTLDLLADQNTFSTTIISILDEV